MKKIINYRPLFYCFLAFAVGIGFAGFIFEPDFFILTLCILLLSTVSIICVIYKLWKRLLFIFLAFVCGIGAFYIDSANFLGSSYNGQNVAIEGRITGEIYQGEGYAYLTLQNVKIESKYDRNINVCVSGLENQNEIIVGNYLSFNADLYNEQLFENNKFNYFAYTDNTPYFCYVNSADITVSSGQKTLTEKLKEYIKTLFSSVMSENGSVFAYNILFGEKSNMDKEVKESFGISGIAHLLAVSGLQIQFLVLILYVILNKLTKNKIRQFIIIATVLLGYCYLCNFTASVVRSMLMCLMFLSSGLLGKPYDLLNSIGLSGLIILAVSPLMIFDAGFQMSFICVLGIALMFKPLTKAFEKIKIPKKISMALAIDLSTTIAIIPVLGIYFGKLSVLTTFANLISVPLFAVGFIILLILTPLICLFNFLGFLLLVPDIILRLIITIAEFVSSIGSYVLTLPELDIALMILFYSSLFVLSRYVLLKFLNKTFIISSIAIVCIVISICFNIPYVPNSYTYTQVNSSDACAVMTTASNEVLVVGGTKSTDYLTDYLKSKKLKRVNTLVVMSDMTDDTYKFIREYNVKTVVLNTIEPTQIGEFNIEFVYLNELKKAVLISVNNFTILFAGSVNLGSNQILLLEQRFENVEINAVYSKKDSQGFSGLSDYDLRFTTFKSGLEDVPTYSLYLLGNFTFEFNNGIIGQVRRA